VSEAAFEGPGPGIVYRERLMGGELALQHCAACGHVTAQHVVLCPACGAAALAWKPASGRGVVHAVTIVRAGPADHVPYCVVLVDLAEGPRVMSRVDGVPPEDVAIGLEVSAAIIVPDAGEPFHVFRPAGAAP
jgi:uncharacterized protein